MKIERPVSISATKSKFYKILTPNPKVSFPCLVNGYALIDLCHFNYRLIAKNPLQTDLSKCCVFCYKKMSIF